jgi:hypothetical protein
MKLSPEQKLEALAARFYQGLVWEPKAGDLYTTSRADLEVYRVVSVENDVVTTEYTENGTATSDWPLNEFTTEGFGPKRVWIPPHVLPTDYGGEECDLIAECQALDEHDNDRV